MKKLAALGLFCALMSTPCFAEEEKAFEVGPALGVGFYNENYGTNLTAGLVFNYKVMPNIGVGVHANLGFLGTKTILAGVSTASSKMYQYLGAVTYYFTEGAPGLWAAGKFGMASQSTTVTTTVSGVSTDISASSSAFAWGPAVGYDHAIADQFTLGLDLSYLMAGFSPNSIGIFQSMVVGKFRF